MSERPVHETGLIRPRGPAPEENGRCRIVLTGGPGGGKTTAADFFRRELGERVVLVPESATILFAGGFPRRPEPEAARAAQRAIYHVQRNLEDVFAAAYPGRVLLCDRGTIDGAAYWPDGQESFFEAFGTTIERELERYDGVVFFESAAVGGISIEGGNPVRIEGSIEAAAIDRRLRALWSRHPRFAFVPHDRSFLRKITTGLWATERLLDDLAACASARAPSVDGAGS
jgi:predicted ATPase